MWVFCCSLFILAGIGLVVGARRLVRWEVTSLRRDCPWLMKIGWPPSLYSEGARRLEMWVLRGAGAFLVGISVYAILNG